VSGVSGQGSKPETRNLLARRSLGEGGTPDTISISDVLVGEVWIGGGQSNMEVPDGAGGLEKFPTLKQARETALAVEADQIRLADMRATWVTPRWSPWVGPKKFTGELAYFALRLHQELKVPIGLIQTAKGGSGAGVWVTPEMLADCPEFMADTYVSKDKRVTPPEKVGSEYRARLADRLVPYAIRGVYWGQGESAAQLPNQNIALTLMALIKGWRKAWGQGDFWFLYTEKTGGEIESYDGGGCAYDRTNPVTADGSDVTVLPNKPNSKAGEARRYLRIRRMLPNVDMVITSDQSGGLHPLNKYGHGQRAAALALGKVYGKTGEYFGPVYAKHVIEGATVRVSFEHVGQGLVFKTNDTVKALQGFALAGEDKVFHWAAASIDGDTVVLTCPAVPKPAAVRYAWEGRFSWANLFNKEGYPALGFRTDEWN
jgi:sialate O-acetylesterase